MKKKVLLLFGGESSEHDVSIRSAHSIWGAIDKEKYSTMLCYIDHSGKWWMLDEWLEQPSQHGGVQIIPVLGERQMMTTGGDKINVDVILPVLHGKNGEDGTVQGLAELLHIPIVGCDTTASAVCMDKAMTKQIAESIGVATAPWRLVIRGTDIPSYTQVASELSDTLFVKPARSGSSVGVSKVRSEDEFERALQLAFEHSDRVLIEAAINGREIETAVLGNPPHHRVSGLGEIIPGNEFYDYDDKYDDNSSSQTTTSVDMNDDLRSTIRDTSYKLYQTLGCSGLARIDYLVDGDTPYLIEVNTFPGFTSISMYPQLWQVSGTELPDLVDELIQLALR